jgi:hypothetical protein
MERPSYDCNCKQVPINPIIRSSHASPLHATICFSCFVPSFPLFRKKVSLWDRDNRRDVLGSNVGWDIGYFDFIMVFPQHFQENVGLLRTLIRSETLFFFTPLITPFGTSSLATDSAVKCSACVCVCLIPSLFPVDRFSQNSVWTLRHWKTFQTCAFYSPAIGSINMAEARICEAKAPVDTLNLLR